MDRSFQPTAAEPMKDKNPKRGSLTMRPITPMSKGSTICAQPLGRPASWKISSTARHDSGVLGDGFTITGAPAATAGAT